VDHEKYTNAIVGDVEIFDLEDLSEISNEIGYQRGASLYECRVGESLLEKIKKESAKNKHRPPMPLPWGIRVVVLESLAPDEWYMVYQDLDGRLFAMDGEGKKLYLPEENTDESI
jgi:hypothetical protein